MTESGILARIHPLLTLARTLRHYENALAKANGDRFNLFEILRLQSDEASHSRMLAELLDPNGSHAQGAVFLKRFLVELQISDFDADSAKVMTEVSVSDGRMDIVLRDGQRREIVIENKIFAQLQNDQLGRYHRSKPAARLLFLTLDGRDPVDWATNSSYTKEFKQNFQSIGYDREILAWLSACRQEAATVPVVREAVTQYIHLIQQLTQQNTSAHMNEEIVKTATHDVETYEAYAALVNAQVEVRAAIVERLNSQLEGLAEKRGWTTTKRLQAKGERWEGLFFTNEQASARNLRFGFEFDGDNYRNCWWGVAWLQKPGNPSMQAQLIKIFEQEAKLGRARKPTENVPLWDCMGNHRNWGDKEMAQVLQGELAAELMGWMQKLADLIGALPGEAGAARAD